MLLLRLRELRQAQRGADLQRLSVFVPERTAIGLEHAESVEELWIGDLPRLSLLADVVQVGDEPLARLLVPRHDLAEVGPRLLQVEENARLLLGVFHVLL